MTPPSPRSWAATIKSEIWKQLKQHNPRDRFIGRYQLQEIWRTTFQNQSDGEPDYEGSQIWNLLIDDQADQTLLTLASILVYIEWDDWSNFRALFIDGQGKPAVQLPLHEETACELAGTKGPNLSDVQSYFLPVTIAQGENLHFSERDHLPFVEKECKTSAGVSATVTKIVIERGYFKDANGETNQQVYGVSFESKGLADSSSNEY